jgi:hypothetical protein
MFSSTVRRVAETGGEAARVDDPAVLVTLAELAGAERRWREEQERHMPSWPSWPS